MFPESDQYNHSLLKSVLLISIPTCFTDLLSLCIGITYKVEKIDKDNFEATLSKYVSSGDLIIDLAYEIATEDFLRWCHRHNVLYINASVEVWDPYMDPQTEDARKFTLYSRHTAIRKLKEEWGQNDGPTAVLDHGANPGLVSHFVKLALPTK